MWLEPKTYKAVGEALETVRKNAKLTQAEVAKKLGKPQSFVSSYEAGQRRVDLLELAAIAEVLGQEPKRLCATIYDGLSKKSTRSKKS